MIYRRILTAIGFLCVLLGGPARDQGLQCRTAPLGSKSISCSSEDFVTQHFPPSSTPGHMATFADSTGQALQDGGAPIATSGGYINKFRNGTMDVWQRGTSALPTSTSVDTYTADGWQVQSQTVAGPCSRDIGTNGALFSLKCLGASGNTATLISQRIESYVAAPLAGSTVTVTFQYKQSSGSTISPSLSTCSASAQDNFSTCTPDLLAASLSACVSSTATWCTESYTFPVSPSASQGYKVIVNCGSGLTAVQACWIATPEIRVTPGVATGINSNPPPPELRPIAHELVFCQRYLEVISAQNGGFAAFGAAQVGATTRALLALTWKVQKRVAPTVTLSSASDWAFFNTAITAFIPWTSFAANTVEWGGQLDVTASGGGLGSAGTVTIAAPNVGTTAARMFIGAEL
jgi:hypothetical protein